MHFARRIAFILLACLGTANLFAAQHHRYKLIDLGTLGGPHSYGEINGYGIRLLNDDGVVGSFADTAQADPNTPNCNVPDCYLAHAFRWKHGTMADLGSLPGINFSAGGSINSHGWIAGQGSSSDVDPNLNVQEGRAILWTNGKLIDLGDLPGGHESLSVYADDNGQVVGFSDNGVPDVNSAFFFPTGTQIRTFIWQNGKMRDIGTLGGASAVPGVNCDGEPRNVVLGASFVNDKPNAATGVPTIEPFLWIDGRMTSLGSLGGTFGTSLCSNARGEIIGNSDLAGDTQSHAFLWRKGHIKDLGTLGGPNSEAIWLNPFGLVVGSADLPGDNLHDAVIWKDGKIRDLGTVDGDKCSRGYGINAWGQVVGLSSDCVNALHAVLWEEDGPLVDLNTLIAPGSGWQLTNAFDINNRGVILAKAAPIGFTPNDDEDLGHLVLLVPCRSDDDACADTADPAPAIPPNWAAHGHAARKVSSAVPADPVQINVAAWRERFAGRFTNLTPMR